MRGRRIHFDESLPAFVSILLDTVPRIDIEKTVFVRDNSGRLAAFVDQDIEEDTISAISEAIAEQLGAYARSDRVLADRNAYGSALLSG